MTNYENIITSDVEIVTRTVCGKLYYTLWYFDDNKKESLIGYSSFHLKDILDLLKQKLHL